MAKRQAPHHPKAAIVTADRAHRHAPVKARRILFYFATFALLVLPAVISGLDWGNEHPVRRIVGFALLLPVGVSVTILWPRDWSRRTQVVSLLMLALVSRLLLLPHRADSDINRYLWEGHLIRAGASPYAHVAAAPAWEHLRDRYWPGMNQKELTTIYPPLAQWTFAAVGGLWYRPVALKLLFIGFDVGVVALLIALLSGRQLSPRFAGLYAFNPVPLLGFAGEGHFDSMLLFFVLLALWLRERERAALSWVALGVAFQMKPIAVLLAPLFFRRGGWRSAWVGAAVAGLPFLPYLKDVPAWVEGVRHFGRDFAFNGSLHALAWNYLGDLRSATRLCAVLLCAWVAGVVWAHRDTVRGAFWIFGGLIVLAPTVHYWYLAWALVFVPLFPSSAWLILSGMMALYFLVRSGGLPVWAHVTIWTSFAVMLVREATVVLRPLLRREARDAQSSANTLAVIVPALNEARTIGHCLESLSRLMPPPDELIVVDGGSTDSTRDVAAEFGATIVLTAPGRGQQIAAGVAVSRSDAVLVVHADSSVAPDTGRRVLAALNANPAAIGGAVGQRFDGDAMKLVIIEMLNEIRALSFGMSFGDQGQFFRRSMLMKAGGFPALPLMEDVEFSLRARSLGHVLYLGGGIVSSGRRWQRESWLKRFATVVRLTTVYRLKRRAAKQLTADLYRRYYPNNV